MGEIGLKAVGPAIGTAAAAAFHADAPAWKAARGLRRKDNRCSTPRGQWSDPALRAVFDTVGDLVQIVDAEGRFVYVNRSWRDALGYNPEDLEGLTLFDIVQPESRAHCIESYEKALA